MMQYISDKGTIIEAERVMVSTIDRIASELGLRVTEQRVEVEDGIALKRAIPIPRSRRMAFVGDYLVWRGTGRHGGHPDVRVFPEVQPGAAFERRYSKYVEPEPETEPDPTPKRSRRRRGTAQS